MTQSRSRRALAVALTAACVGMAIAAVVLLVLGGGYVLDSNKAGGFVLAVDYPLLGCLIAWHQPRHAIGWVFIGIGLSQAVNALATQYAYYSLIASPGALPLAPEAAWLAVWTWAPGTTLLLVFAILLFPTGALPSARWRPVAAAGWIAMLMMSVPLAVAAWPQRGPDLVVGEPVADPGAGLLGLFLMLPALGLVLLSAAAIASVVSLVLRFRQAQGRARQQLKWFTYAGVIEIGATVIFAFVELPQPLGLVEALVVLPLLPVATAIAILRHRLFDIDVIIKRTVTYGVLSLVLAAAYVAGVLLLSRLLEPFVEQAGGLVVAGSTLAVAALFQPARRRIQAAVDRRFDRTLYDATAIAEELSASLREAVELEGVRDQVVTAVERTMRPASVSLWLRPRGQ